jgi:hypothetical protein
MEDEEEEEEDNRFQAFQELQQIIEDVLQTCFSETNHGGPSVDADRKKICQFLTGFLASKECLLAGAALKLSSKSLAQNPNVSDSEHTQHSQ